MSALDDYVSRRDAAAEAERLGWEETRESRVARASAYAARRPEPAPVYGPPVVDDPVSRQATGTSTLPDGFDPLAIVSRIRSGEPDA